MSSSPPKAGVAGPGIWLIVAGQTWTMTREDAVELAVAIIAALARREDESGR